MNTGLKRRFWAFSTRQAERPKQILIKEYYLIFTLLKNILGKLQFSLPLLIQLLDVQSVHISG